jgi:hypothetical protein
LKHSERREILFLRVLNAVHDTAGWNVANRSGTMFIEEKVLSLFVADDLHNGKSYPS